MPRNFNGTSDMIRADGACVTGTSLAASVAAWVKGGSGGGCVYGDGNTGNQGWAILASATNLRVFVKNQASTTLLDSTGAGVAFDSTWHHVAFTQDSVGNWVRYIDGASDGASTYTASALNGGMVRAGIGVLPRSGNGNFFAGLIAHCATWKRQLSAQEVKSLANGMSPPMLGPAHYWPLWGADSPEADLASPSVDGTLTGSTLGAGGPRVGPSLLELAA